MTSIEYTGYKNLILCVSVWAEDTWLQEHAGETITEQEKEKGEKRSAVSDTVCKEFSIDIMKKCLCIISSFRCSSNNTEKSYHQSTFNRLFNMFQTKFRPNIF